MRNYSSDQDLTDLANQVDLLTFELKEADYVTFQERFQAGTLINVSMFPDGKTFRVRFCLGGRQRVLGLTKRGPEAAKFADLAKLFFWPYRLRCVRLPDEADFNYGLEDTKHDLEHNVAAEAVLGRIRDHLMESGELKQATWKSEEERMGRKVARETRRTASGELRRFLLEHAAERIELDKTLHALQVSNEKSFDQIKQAFHHILEQLALASKEREQLRHMIATPTVAIGQAIHGIPAPQPDVVWCSTSGKVITCGRP